MASLSRNFQTSTAGSYGHLVMSLAQGLETAVKHEWITSDEAKKEFRLHLMYLARQEQVRDEIACLEDRMSRLEDSIAS